MYVQGEFNNLFDELFLRIALWVKFSAEDILKYFSCFSQKIGFDISCKLSPLETISGLLAKPIKPIITYNFVSNL